MRIIVGALLAGVVAFALVAVYLVEAGGLKASPGLGRPLLAALGLLAVGAFGAFAAVRRAILRAVAGPAPATGSDPGERFAAFARLTIVGAALAEGLALFSTVVYLLTATPAALVGTAVGAFLIAAQAPSQERLRRFLEGS